MTKSELIELLKDTPDEEEIHIKHKINSELCESIQEVRKLEHFTVLKTFTEEILQPDGSRIAV